jgi:hypothetical protein
MRGTLKAVQLENLTEAWQLIRDDIATISRADGWLDADVYMTIRSNGATLFLIYDADLQYAGFAVLRLMSEFDGPRLHLWILYAKDAEFDVIDEFEEDLMNIARAAKAQRVTFGTTRPGFEKIATRRGFKLREVVYERAVKYQLAPPNGPMQ